MKSKDLRERATEDLLALREATKKELFSHRMKNLTNQLDDTSLLNKGRKDIARIEAILHERTLGSANAAVIAEKGSQS
ncbi:MAG TPA: 50S ribosomal protein L29 [Polyangiaceae bacterium]